MKLENWALIRRQQEDTGGLVLPQDYNLIKSYGFGDVYGRPDMESGRAIAT